MFEFLDDLMITVIKIALFCLIIFGISVIVLKIPIWLIAIIIIGFPTAYLLDKYWWRNTEMYRSKMDKLVEEMKNNH